MTEQSQQNFGSRMASIVESVRLSSGGNSRSKQGDKRNKGVNSQSSSSSHSNGYTTGKSVSRDEDAANDSYQSSRGRKRNIIEPGE